MEPEPFFLPGNQHAFTYDWVTGFTTQGWGHQVPLGGRPLYKTSGPPSPLPVSPGIVSPM